MNGWLRGIGSWGRTLVLAVPAISLSLGTTHHVHASMVYPSVVAETVELKSPPPCTLCHQTSSGGSATATKPFAESLQERGLKAQNPELLRTVLLTMERENVSSLDDGVSDITKLRAGKDPNVANDSPAPETIEKPSYGCGGATFASGKPGSHTGHVWWLAVAPLLVVARRLRSRRPARGQVAGQHPRTSG